MVDFESILAPKWRPNGTQHAPKTVSKIDRKNDWIFDRFLEAPGGRAQVQGWVEDGSRRAQEGRRGTPLPKLLAEAKSDMRSQDIKLRLNIKI